EPEARLHLGAGGATSGSAPIKIDSGTLLANAEAGAIEFDGDDLYYTDNEATPQRHALAKDEILFNTPIITSQLVTYQHPRDPSELNGNTSYSSSGYTTYGMYEQMTSDTEVSAIKADVWCTNISRDVTFKVFQRADRSVFNPDTETPLYSGIIDHTIMPHSSTSGGYLFSLSNQVTVPAGQYLFVIWESIAGGEIRISYFNSNSSSAPYRHPFIVGPKNTEGYFYYTEMGSNYYGASFRVYADADITRASKTYLGSEELLLNSSFEIAGSGGNDIWNSWSESSESGGIISNEAILIHSGASAVKLASSGVKWFSPQVRQALTVVANKKYQLSFWARGNGTHAGKYAIYDLTNGNYLNGTASGMSTGIAGTDYAQVVTTFVAPSGCSSVVLYFVPDNSSAGNIAYFDDVSVKQFVTSETLQPLSIQTVLNNLPS
ncbi:MAG: hypothetical protein EOM59_21025, partial [Clostridia bacterium]|nr:hypothetical protein [Clostridia bacterium]